MTTATQPAQLILDELETIKTDLRDFTKQDLFLIGSKLTDVLDYTRQCYRLNSERGEANPVTAKRVAYTCPQCLRVWYGNDLAGTATTVESICVFCERANAISDDAMRISGPAPTSEPEPAPATLPTPDASAGPIADGTYTVVMGESYRTIRIKTQEPDATFMPGKRIASFLNGPDNYRNYQGFAFVDDHNQPHIWKRFYGADDVISALAVLLSGRDAMISGLRAYGMRSGTCGCCGKKLTTPESIALGIGPICAGKLGL